MKSTCHPILHFKIGVFSCIALRDGDDWDRNCLYVDTGAHKVLIDSGNGDCSQPPGLLLERLADEGVALDGIDTVVITHADIDHIAGVVDARGAPMLPKARIVLTQVGCEHRLSAALRFPNVAVSQAVLDNLRESEDVPRRPSAIRAFTPRWTGIRRSPCYRATGCLPRLSIRARS